MPKRTLPTRIGAVAAGEPGFENRRGGIDPRHGHRAAGFEHHDGVRIGRGYLGDQIVLIVRQRKAGQVHAFALPLVGEDDGHIGALGERGRSAWSSPESYLTVASGARA